MNATLALENESSHHRVILMTSSGIPPRFSPFPPPCVPPSLPPSVWCSPHSASSLGFEMPEALQKSVSILGSTGQGMAMFSLGKGWRGGVGGGRAGGIKHQSCCLF